MCAVPVAQNVFQIKSILRKDYVVIYVSVATIAICWVCCVVNVIQLSSVVSLPVEWKIRDEKGKVTLFLDTLYSVIPSDLLCVLCCAWGGTSDFLVLVRSI
jgi:hypothetical protein